jgi:hypothetical protein
VSGRHSPLGGEAAISTISRSQATASPCDPTTDPRHMSANWRATGYEPAVHVTGQPHGSAPLCVRDSRGRNGDEFRHGVQSVFHAPDIPTREGSVITVAYREQA